MQYGQVKYLNCNSCIFFCLTVTTHYHKLNFVVLQRFLSSQITFFRPKEAYFFDTRHRKHHIFILYFFQWKRDAKFTIRIKL